MRIFISYRREDSAGHTGRLFDHLSNRFGSQHIFMDIDTIRPGDDFRKAIEKAMSTCDVVLAVIGKQWLTITDSNGRRRLDNPGDFVHAEIASALVNPNILVIPVLVRDAGMPAPNELPDDLKELSWRNAIELSDKRFLHDVDTLIEVIESRVEKPSVSVPEAQPRRPVTKYGIVAAGLAGLCITAGLLAYGVSNLWNVAARPEITSTSAKLLPAAPGATTVRTSTATLAEPDETATATIEIPATEDVSPGSGSISGLSVRKPTLNEIRDDLLSIWDANLLDVQDIRTPGSIEYDGEAKVEDEYLWTWHWCAADREVLQGNRAHMDVRFYIDGEALPSEDAGPVLVYDYDLVPSNTPCSYWSTVIGGWRAGRDYQLKLTYTFTEDIDDGSSIYPAGDYSHVLTVTGK